MCVCIYIAKKRTYKYVCVYNIYLQTQGLLPSLTRISLTKTMKILNLRSTRGRRG